MRQSVVVLGSGGIGRAVGLLLRELGDIPVDLAFGDIDAAQARSAADFVTTGRHAGLVESFVMPATGETPEMRRILAEANIILDCLPGGLAPRAAAWALEHGLHYANLTEYVAETNQIIAMAAGASTGFALQNGLAPGYIDVLGVSLFQRFCAEYGVDHVDTLALRVGALTKEAEAPHFYGFTWSPIGVATEYVKDAVVIRDWRTTTAPSLTEVRGLVLDGIPYEEALTSGGAADLPDTLAGRVRHLDYKTLRWPGHYAWVQAQLAAIGPVDDRIRRLERRFLDTIPSVDDDDIVVVYAAAEGLDAQGRRRRLQKSLSVRPVCIGGRPLRAIQSTTAAGLAEAAALLLRGQHKGVLFQSQIDAAAYLGGPFVGAIYR